MLLSPLGFRHKVRRLTQKHLSRLLLPAAGIRPAVLHGAHSRFIRLFSPRTDPAARCEITIVPPNNWLTIAIPLDEAAPSLQPHYRAFLTTTSDSAPVLRLGTQGLAGAACLTGSLHIGATGSHVPHGSQDHGHAPFMPDAGWAIIGHPPTLSQERDPLLVSTSPGNLSTRHQGFAHARLRDPHLTGITGLFPQRSRQRLLTDAAWGGLKPAPESRLRRAYLHLPYSSANPLGLRS